MKPDLFLHELFVLAKTKSGASKASVKTRQKQLQRLHAEALRRAMRRLRDAKHRRMGHAKNL